MERAWVVSTETVAVTTSLPEKPVTGVVDSSVARANKVIRRVAAVFIGVELLALLSVSFTATTTTLAFVLTLAAGICCVAAWLLTLVFPRVHVMVLLAAMSVAAVLYVFTHTQPLNTVFATTALWVSTVTLTAALIMRTKPALYAVATISVGGLLAMLYVAYEDGTLATNWPDVVAVTVNAVCIGVGVVGVLYWLLVAARRADKAVAKVEGAGIRKMSTEFSTSQLALLQDTVHDTALNTFTVLSQLPHGLPPQVVSTQAKNDLEMLSELKETLVSPPAPPQVGLTMGTVGDCADSLEIRILWKLSVDPAASVPDNIQSDIASGMCHLLMHAADLPDEVVVEITTSKKGMSASVHVENGKPDRVAPPIFVEQGDTYVTFQWLSDPQAIRPVPALSAGILVPSAVSLSAATIGSVFIQAAFLSAITPRLDLVFAGIIATAATGIGIAVVKARKVLPVWAAVLMLAALAPATILSASDLSGCAAAGQSFWGPLASTPLVAVLCILTARWWVMVTAAVVYFASIAVVLAPSAADQVCTDSAAPKLLSRLAIIVAAITLGMAIRKYSRQVSRSSAKAEALRQQTDALAAAADVSDRHMRGVLSQSRVILTRIAGDESSRVSAELKRQCEEEVVLLKFLGAVPAEMGPAGDVLIEIAVTAHRRNIRVELTSPMRGETPEDVGYPSVAQLRDVGEALVNSSPAALLVAIDSGGVMTLSAKEPAVPVHLASGPHVRVERRPAVTIVKISPDRRTRMPVLT
jgi:hypothetical protein